MLCEALEHTETNKTWVLASSTSPLSGGSGHLDNMPCVLVVSVNCQLCKVKPDSVEVLWKL